MKRVALIIALLAGLLQPVACYAQFNGGGGSGGSGASITTGTWASRPSSSSGSQKIYFATDAPCQVIDTGSTLKYQAFGIPVYPPISSELTLYEDASFTTDYTAGGLNIIGTTSANQTNHMIGKAIVGGSNIWTVTIGFIPKLSKQNFAIAGIAIKETASNKCIDFSWQSDGLGNMRLVAHEYNGQAFVADIYSGGYDAVTSFPVYQVVSSMTWLRITCDGATRSYQYSADGHQWYTAFTDAYNNYFTAGQWGVRCGGYFSVAADTAAISCYSMYEGANP